LIDPRHQGGDIGVMVAEDGEPEARSAEPLDACGKHVTVEAQIETLVTILGGIWTRLTLRWAA